MISSQVCSVSYTGDGTTDTFAYTFVIQSGTWLNVYVDAVLKTLNSDYTVTGVGSGSGGNVVFTTAPADDTSVLIERTNVPMTQTTDYIQGDPFSADSHELALDKLTSLVQQIDNKLDNAIQIPEGETGITTTLPSIADRANLLLGFDEDGDIEMVTYVAGDPTNKFIQAGVGAIERTYQDKVRETISATDFDVTLTDDSTDDSTALTQALDVAQYELNLPNGTYNIHNIYLTGQSLRGAGHGTRLEVNGDTNGDTALRLGYISSPGLWTRRRISNLMVDGVDATDFNGLTLDAVSTTQLSGRWVIDRVVFKNCQYGFYKPNGNIGNVIRDCYFVENKYGYRAFGKTSPVMHGGNDIISTTEFSGNTTAALFFDSPTSGTGGTVIRDCIIESNPGMGIFVKEWKDSFTPLHIDNVWFEANSDGPDVDIDNVTYTPRDIYLEDTALCIMRGSTAGDIELVNSSLQMDGCFFTGGYTLFTVDSNSLAVSDNANMLNAGVLPIETRSLAFINGGGGNAMVTYVPTRTVKSINVDGLLQSITFDTADEYTFTGTATVTGTTTRDGRIFDSCCSVTISTGRVEQAPSVNITADKFYVMTIDIKALTAMTGFSVSFISAVTLCNDFAPLLKNGEWVTIGSVSKATSSGAVRLRMENTSGSDRTLLLSALQIVEFDTMIEAINYFNSGLYTKQEDRPALVYSTVAPTHGTWKVGDTVLKINPSAGNPKGWYCTTGGTPGTWTSLGNL